jgi:hypothetical protein
MYTYLYKDDTDARDKRLSRYESIAFWRHFLACSVLERISLPVHSNKPLKTGLLRHLMKISDISETEL